MFSRLEAGRERDGRWEKIKLRQKKKKTKTCLEKSKKKKKKKSLRNSVWRLLACAYC